MPDRQQSRLVSTIVSLFPISLPAKHQDETSFEQNGAGQRNRTWVSSLFFFAICPPKITDGLAMFCKMDIGQLNWTSCVLRQVYLDPNDDGDGGIATNADLDVRRNVKTKIESNVKRNVDVKRKVKLKLS